MDGLWSLVLDFRGRRGGAAIVINNGKILGGDAGFTYTGSIKQDNAGMFNGTIRAKQFLAHPDAFFPGANAFDVTISGSIKDGRLSGVASVSIAPGQQIKISAKKEADL